MKHLGDITKISGYTAPIVDCIDIRDREAQDER